MKCFNNDRNFQMVVGWLVGCQWAMSDWTEADLGLWKRTEVKSEGLLIFDFLGLWIKLMWTSCCHLSMQKYIENATRQEICDTFGGKFYAVVEQHLLLWVGQDLLFQRATTRFCMWAWQWLWCLEEQWAACKTTLRCFVVCWSRKFGFVTKQSNVYCLSIIGRLLIGCSQNNCWPC